MIAFSIIKTRIDAKNSSIAVVEEIETTFLLGNSAGNSTNYR
ncbi:unnamed protein product [Staurois parvus]|uniref:Uncharacterized protein n=1 Tax=Staurois parvus TaxID=386267 RepID=A0ABN9HIC9_9NEOB|nr:unnamed protein product [Staurois parvus]